MAKSWLVFAVCVIVMAITQGHADVTNGDDDTSDTITFYFVRHGEGDRSDERMPLASRGLERAHRLARILERAQLTHVFSSHTLRSIQAVEPAAKYHGLDVVELPPLGTEIDGQVIHEVSPSDLAIGPLSEALSKVPVGSTVLVGVNALVPDSSPIAQTGLLFYQTIFDENAACHIALGRTIRGSISGGTEMSDDDFSRVGGNLSSVHVDFMIGSNETNVDGITIDGEHEAIMRDGEWVFEMSS